MNIFFQNTFWFGLGACSILLIPSIIFSIKLAKYYRRMDTEDVFEEWVQSCNDMDRVVSYAVFCRWHILINSLLLTVFDSHISSLCVFHALSLCPALLTHGTLHSDVWSLSVIYASFRLLPLTISCVVWTCSFWISSHCSLFPSQINHTVFLSWLGFWRPPPFFQLYFLHKSLHPRFFQLSLLSSFFSLLLCCSMSNTGNRVEHMCEIHGDLAVVRYEWLLCLLACFGLIRWRNHFFSLNEWVTFSTFQHRWEKVPICMNMYVSVRAHVALPIPTFWPISLGRLLPRATQTGDPEESSMRYRLSFFNFPLFLIYN